MHVLMITSEWPSPEIPNAVPFIVREVELLRSTGVNVDVFRFRGNKNPINYLFAWAKVQKLLHVKQYDIIHAQWGQSALLCLPKKIPLVITFRGDDVHGIAGKKTRQTLQGFVLRLVSRCTASIADERILVSRNMATSLAIQHYHVIPSGINLDKFCPVDKNQARLMLGLPDKDLVLFVGSQFNPVKRLPLIKEAVALAQASNSNLKLISLGDVSHDLIPSYMNACDVLVLASVHEGSPNVIKEALACNLPVVSTDVGDVRERIGAIEGCIVCKDDHPETIAMALAEVLSRRQRIEGRKTVLELDEHFLMQKIIQVYRQAIEKAEADAH